MAVQLQLRRGSAAQWTAANTLLAQGELGLETDTGKLKIGDGSTVWTSLAYYTAGSAAVTSVNGQTGTVVLTASDISGLGTIASQAASNVTITGGSITGITDLAVADGGTGASTASGARTNLGLVIGTDVLAPNGSAANLTSFPTLNQNTTGTASNVTGTVAVANGGTGATTASDARTNLGLVIGTDILSPTGSAAGLTSFPTLNQNTTGTASNVTGTVAVANGGTGATTAAGARTNLGLVIGTDVLAPNGSAASLTSFPTFNQNTTGTASNVTGTVAIANGGTGQTTAVAAFDALSPATTKGDLIVSNGTDNIRLAVGTDAYVLTADSTQASGVKWAAASGGGSALTVKDEGTTLSTAVTSIDFTGAGVTATNTGGAISVAISGGGSGISSADIQEFTTAGTSTWTKPAGAKLVYILAYGGGGGGGSGRRRAVASVGTAVYGGGGGGAGGRTELWIPATELGSTETVTVGAGGTGGAARTTDDTSGASGVSGDDSSVGSWLLARAGGGGSGATAASGGGGSSGGSMAVTSGGATLYSFNGGTGQTSAGSAGNKGGYNGGGGGGGAGFAAGSTTEAVGGAGGKGGAIFTTSATSSAGGGTAGAVHATGGNGSNATTDFVGGDGGGGGGSGNAVAAGAGGNGGFPAGAGGGGGAGHGANSGAGGNGGNGYVRIVTFF